MTCCLLFVSACCCSCCSFHQLGSVRCIIVLLRVCHFFFTATQHWTQPNPTAYFIIVHTRRTTHSLPATNTKPAQPNAHRDPPLPTLCSALIPSGLLPGNCSAIYLSRLVGKLINNFVKSRISYNRNKGQNMWNKSSNCALWEGQQERQTERKWGK